MCMCVCVCAFLLSEFKRASSACKRIAALTDMCFRRRFLCGCVCLSPHQRTPWTVTCPRVRQVPVVEMLGHHPCPWTPQYQTCLRNNFHLNDGALLVPVRGKILPCPPLHVTTTAFSLLSLPVHHQSSNWWLLPRLEVFSPP